MTPSTSPFSPRGGNRGSLGAARPGGGEDGRVGAQRLGEVGAVAVRLAQARALGRGDDAALAVVEEDRGGADLLDEAQEALRGRE
jgi:hypothetical protein